MKIDNNNENKSCTSDIVFDLVSTTRIVHWLYWYTNHFLFSSINTVPVMTNPNTRAWWCQLMVCVGGNTCLCRKWKWSHQRFMKISLLGTIIFILVILFFIRRWGWSHNGWRGMERCLPLSICVLPSTLIKCCWFKHFFMRKVDVGGETGNRKRFNQKIG